MVISALGSLGNKIFRAGFDLERFSSRSWFSAASSVYIYIISNPNSKQFQIPSQSPQLQSNTISMQPSPRSSKAMKLAKLIIESYRARNDYFMEAMRQIYRQRDQVSKEAGASCMEKVDRLRKRLERNQGILLAMKRKSLELRLRLKEIKQRMSVERIEEIQFCIELGLQERACQKQINGLVHQIQIKLERFQLDRALNNIETQPSKKLTERRLVAQERVSRLSIQAQILFKQTVLFINNECLSA